MEAGVLPESRAECVKDLLQLSMAAIPTIERALDLQDVHTDQVQIHAGGPQIARPRVSERRPG